jgi:EAL domain-containing protein (putative c-di-GMP-specific phosphodiesterase class I)
MTVDCRPSGASALVDHLTNATVLIADDHDANVVLLRRILDHAGVTRVHTTTDPLRVVEQYRDVRPDIVLLDLHMPGMDGVAVMDAIRRSTPAGHYVPVVVLTADATPQARNRVLDAGANDFLTKPVDRTEVMLRVRNLLHTRALHDTLRAHNLELEAEIADRDADRERARAEHAATRDRVVRALSGDVLHMVFQPIAELATGATVGVEALARFADLPARPPNEWFRDAAEVGLAIDLELAAVRRALGHLDLLRVDECMTVNVSPATATSAQLTALLADVDATRIVLEVTEHAAVDDYDLLVSGLAALRADGIRVAVDDAGAGFASLNHILRIQPDIIKLDIALVRDIDRDPVKRALASSLVTFAGDIGATLIAEGVESPDELRTLRELDVPWGQGYLIARPAPLTDAR